MGAGSPERELCRAHYLGVTIVTRAMETEAQHFCEVQPNTTIKALGIGHQREKSLLDRVVGLRPISRKMDRNRQA